MKGKKKRPTRGEEVTRFLQSFEENQLIDDHGDVIIGERDKKPVIRGF